MESSEFLYPPLASITSTDRRGVLWVIGVICLAHIYLTLALRLTVRWRRFQLDDYAITGACGLVLCQSGVVFAALALGLGRADIVEDEARAAMAWRLFLASEALFISAIFVAKAGVLLTVESLLARDMTVRIVFRCTLGAVAMMGLGSLLAITIGCGSHSLLTEETAQCSQKSRWIAVATIDSVSEVWGFSLFCWVVWSLQMKATYKLTASAMIGLRLFCVAFAAVHAHRITLFEQSSLPSVTIIKPLVWQNLSLMWSLLSAMAVALKPFLKDFHTGMGMDLGHVAESNYGSGSKKFTKQGYMLHDMSPNGSKGSKAAREDTVVEVEPDSTKYLTDDNQYVAEIYHEGRKPSVGSMRSEDPIIRKQVDYDVTYHAT